MNRGNEGRKRAWIVLSFVGIACSLPLVVRMLAEGWRQQQLVYQLALALAGLPGLNVSLVVFLPTGAVLGLLAVFALDGYKVVQRVILLVGVPLFAGAVWALGLWTPETLDWSYWWGIPLGAVVGGVVGLPGASVSGEGRRTFPGAAHRLYAVVVVAVGVGFVERHLTYASPLAVQRGTGRIYTQWPGVPGVALDLWTPLYLVASVALVLVLGAFVSYSDRHDVLVLSRDTGTALRLLNGLYLAADREPEYEEVERTKGATAMVDMLIYDDVEEAVNPDDLNKGFAFQFIRSGSLSRRRIVEYAGLELPFEEDVGTLERRTEQRGTLGRLVRLAGTQLSGAVPEWVADPFRNRSYERVDRIDGAESLVLLVPLSDVVASPDRPGEFSRPAYMDRLERLYELYRDDPGCDVFFVVTEAHLGEAALVEEEDNYLGLHDELAEFVGETLLGVPDAGPDTIPVRRGDETDQGDDGEGRQGFNRVLDRL